MALRKWALLWHLRMSWRVQEGTSAQARISSNPFTRSSLRFALADGWNLAGMLHLSHRLLPTCYPIAIATLPHAKNHTKLRRRAAGSTVLPSSSRR